MKDPKFKIISARRLPHAIKDQTKQELDRMVDLKVITPVSEPTPAVCPMLVVKKGDKIRICTDPTELNKNIVRRPYPLKTVEEIAAKVKRKSQMRQQKRTKMKKDKKRKMKEKEKILQSPSYSDLICIYGKRNAHKNYTKERERKCRHH